MAVLPSLTGAVYLPLLQRPSLRPNSTNHPPLRNPTHYHKSPPAVLPARSPVLLHSHPSYDVFLSYHGQVRHTIVDHLYAALIRKGIKPFKDDVQMPRGLEIKEAISNGIEHSSLYLLLLSPGYASSSFCLDETTEIMNRCCCCSPGSKLALPIFYLVSPDDVCLPTAGCFKEHFLAHFANYSYARVQGWIENLSKVGNISGWVHEKGRSEAMLVEDVSTTIGKMVHEMSAGDFTNNSSPSLVQVASSRSDHYEDKYLELKYFQPQISSTQGNDSIVRIPKPAYADPRGVNHCLCLVAQVHYYSDAGHQDLMNDDVTTIATEARRLWDDEKIEVEPLQTTTAGNNSSNYCVVMIRFGNQHTRDWVLESSPCLIYGTQFYMRKWKGEYSSEYSPVKIPMWVRLYNVPEEYMNPEGLSYIASALGKPMYVDRATADGYRHSQIQPYAKVCVEISSKDEAITLRPAAERTMVISIGDEKEENLVVVTAVYQLEDYGDDQETKMKSTYFTA